MCLSLRATATLLALLGCAVPLAHADDPDGEVVSGEGQPAPVETGPDADESIARLLASQGVANADELFDKTMSTMSTPVGPRLHANRARRGALIMTLLAPIAEAGHHGAQVAIARAHLHGDDLRRDVPAAVALLRSAADAGHDEAQQVLGMLHALGIGVPLDPALAVTHYYFAAEGGNTAAQLALAYRYLHGVDTPKSCQKAVMYYNPVAEKVVAAAQKSGGRGLIIEKARLTDGPARASRRLLGDEDDIIQYYQYSADKGSVDAQLTLGQLSFHGARGMPADPAVALSYYSRAADAGEPAAHAHLGHMYAQGIGVEQDDETALKHFRLGAARSNPAAQNGLGYMYMHGYGVEVSHAKALEHFRAAAQNGNAEAQFNLGAMYISGTGIKKAYDKALHYFTLAAHQGHTLALYNLGQMHLNGLGAPRSCPAAAQFLKAVAERGEWGADLEKGHRAFSAEADPFRALLLYAGLAEGGFEVAQANAAHIADSAVRRGVEHSELQPVTDAKALALDMFARAAQQGNVEARIKLGDYHFYGLGTRVDAESAVGHYRTASESQNAQAMFNLAYMHAHGLGLPRDFHLAKRHYDMAMDASTEAVLPVRIALVELYGMQLIEDMLQWPAVQRLRDSAVWTQVATSLMHGDEWQWDTIAIVVISPLLLMVAVIRRQRAMLRRE